MQIINSADEAIDALGGNKSVAGLFGIVQSAICNWRARGRLPPETFVVFTRELSRRGLIAAPELWSMRQAKGEPADAAKKANGSRERRAQDRA